jgi:hypothetical protein
MRNKNRFIPAIDLVSALISIADAIVDYWE